MAGEDGMDGMDAALLAHAVCCDCWHSLCHGRDVFFVFLCFRRGCVHLRQRRQREVRAQEAPLLRAFGALHPRADRGVKQRDQEQRVAAAQRTGVSKRKGTRTRWLRVLLLLAPHCCHIS